MVNPNLTRPEPEQYAGAHGPVARFAAKAAILLTLAGAGNASLESTAQASPELRPDNIPEQPSPVVSRSLNKLTHVKVGDELKIMNGETASLVVHAGATAYRQTQSGIHKEKLTEDAAITNGLYASEDSKPIVSYAVTKSAHNTERYSLPLSGRNSRYIEKNVYDNDYTSHREPFKPSEDISYSMRRVDMVHKGVAYQASKPSEVSAQHVNGRWVEPLARAYESDEPVPAAPERTHSSSEVVRGLKELNHAEVGDEINVLTDKTASLYARKGTVTYGFSGGKLVKSRLPQGQQLVHASYKHEAGHDLAFYRHGGHSYSIRLDDPANRGKIYENFYQNNDYRNETAFRIKHFSPLDISTRTVRIDAIDNGELFSRSGINQDPYTSEVGDSGHEMVRVAQSNGSPD